MTLKALLAAVAVAAIAVGFALPVPPSTQAAAQSQVETLAPGQG